jgi:hypothetical protein
MFNPHRNVNIPSDPYDLFEVMYKKVGGVRKVLSSALATGACLGVTICITWVSEYKHCCPRWRVADGLLRCPQGFHRFPTPAHMAPA